MTLAEQLAHARTGAVYNDLTAELIDAREQTVLLTNRYNASFGATPDEREALLRKLLGRVGKGVHFEPTFRCEFGVGIEIGNDFYANFDCIILDAGGVTIGDKVLFGPRVGIYTSDHAIHPEERAAGACRARPVTVGHRVWIGAGVHINGGVTIGEDSIIGSGSVVTKDIPAGVIAAGVPARPIREITEADRTGFRA
ncbi:sugar O-acetyltransferase [Salinicola rhizosphaerae]|uniref:Acetyltransferase n=1 Tax=Salinicola rhizosphaerae TaxID=1443141 RepID=A0ABQ3DTS5_9GAMM|nr:sugar O-acetyltransferase [Salinicola rhizosphaerae]GHB14961.1 acetyltransferase [Salinicola rhizosphaerae]